MRGNEKMKSTLKKWGGLSVQLQDFYTHFHIKKIGEDYIILEDFCDILDIKDGRKGDSFRIELDLGDQEDIDFKRYCKKIVTYSKKNKKCPEVGIHLEVNCLLEEVY
jgi:hypothetical protein